MSGWLDVANTNELTPGTRRIVDVDGAAVAVFNLDGEYFAIEDVCPHDGGDLAKGALEGEIIICPRHGARFSIKTGAVLGPPAYEDLKTFKLQVVNGKVQIEVE
jgi:3-phenylpropionate/trans-cinnamate dioxygenase ferredoxin subunit